jgi:hypothetical protein
VKNLVERGLKKLFAKTKEKKDSSYATSETHPQKDQNVLEAY